MRTVWVLIFAFALAPAASHAAPACGRAIVPLNLAAVKSRILKANAEGAQDVLLPELATDVHWAIDSIPGILGEVSKTRHLPAKELGRLGSAAGLLRSKLQSLLQPSDGVSYRSWLALGLKVTEFADLTQVTPHAGLWFEQDMFRFRADQTDIFIHELNEPIQSYRFYKDVDLSTYPNRWIPLPTTEPLSLERINEWVAQGFAALGMSDRPSAFDGITVKMDGSPFIPDPSDLYRHDWTAHWLSLQSRETGLTIGPEEFFLMFRQWKASEKDDGFHHRNLEVFWFWVFHETLGGVRNYGPTSLIDELAKRFSSNFDELRPRLRKHDIGDIYEGRYPTDASLRRSLDALQLFARKVEILHGMPRLSTDSRN